MKMVHILHHQSDEIVAFSNQHFQRAVHLRNSSLEETFDFTYPTTEKLAPFLTKRNRIVIPDEDGQFREFIISYVEKFNDDFEVKAGASYLDLQKAKAITPITLTGQTPATAASFVLQNTGWSPGKVDYTGVRKITFDKRIKPYDALKQLASDFGLELVFRVEIDGNRIVRRVVDLVEKVGTFRGKEITYRKDLLGFRKKEKSDDFVTALICLGPEKEDGTRLTTIVEDKDAKERWGRNGQHLWDDYEPQSTDQDMTLERLTSLGQTALQKRINSQIEYEITQAVLETIKGYEHEKVRYGDTVRIKDLHYKPALYMEARVISVERDLVDPSNTVYILGEFIEYTQRDVLAEFDDFKKNMRIRIIKQPTPPQGAYNVLWVDTSRPVHVLHTWDGVQWRKVTPTEASEVGAVTPEESQEQANKGRDEAKEYTDDKVVEIGETIEQVQQDVFNRERVIKRQPTEPVNPLYGDLWVDTSDPLQPMYMWNGTEWRALGPTNADEMGAVLKEEYEQKVQEIIADLANKVPNENYSSTVQEIMSSLDGKAGLEYVNGQLSSKVNTGTVYTKTEVDNALNSRVLKTTYETDKTGIVQRLDSSENRLTVNEKEIGLRAKQQALDTVSQRVTSAEQAIVLQDGKIELMVEKETFNNLKGTVESYGTRITQAESNINLKAEKTALTTTNQNVSNALQSITNLQTEIDLAHEQIALRAKQTDFNTLSNQVSSHQAQLTVQANEIASRVTQNQFNALSVGGRNYILKTANRISSCTSPSSLQSDRYDVSNDLVQELKAGATFTLSYEISASSFQNGTTNPFIGFEMRCVNQHESVMYIGYNGSKEVKNGTSEWKRIARTFVLPKDVSRIDYARVHFRDFTGTVWIRKLQLEKGSMKDWREAPEDLNEKMNGLDGRISKAETTIHQTATELKSLAKKSELDTVSGRLDAAESTISQQAESISQRVTSSKFTQEIANTKAYVDSSAQAIANTAESNVKSYTDEKISTVTTRLTSAESLIAQQATEIKQRVTRTDVTNLLLDDKTVKDTRNTNENPSFYWNHYKRQRVEEFKFRKVIGAPGSTTYGTLLTVVPWNDSSGGPITQSFRSNDGIFKRKSISTTSWSTWIEIEDTDGSQAKINALTANEIRPLKTRVSTAESTITQQATQITQMVSQTDFNGQTIISLINQTASKIKIQAAYIDLKGAVTVISDITGDLGVIHTGILNSVEINSSVIRGGHFEGTTRADSMNIGPYGARIDTALMGIEQIKAVRLNVNSNHYLALNEHAQFTFVMNNDFNTWIRPAEDDHVIMKLGRPIIKGLRTSDVIGIRNSADNGYADLWTKGLLCYGDIKASPSLNVSSWNGYAALSAAIENKTANETVYLRPSGTGSVKVVKNTGWSEYRPIMASDFSTNSTVISKTNIKEFIENASDYLDIVKIFEYNLISDVHAGIYDRKKIGMLLEGVPGVMKLEQGVNLYTVISLVWKQNQEQKQQIEALQQDKQDIYTILGVMSDEIEELKKAVSAV